MKHFCTSALDARVAVGTEFEKRQSLFRGIELAFLFLFFSGLPLQLGWGTDVGRGKKAGTQLVKP